MRTFSAWLRQSTAALSDLFGTLTVHVGLALLDQFHGVAIESLIIIGGIIVSLFPVPAQPAQVLLDRLDEFDILFFRIGIVKAQVAHPAKFLCHTKVETDGLGVTDVQIAVGFGREAGHELSPKPVGRQVCGYFAADKIAGGKPRGLSLSYLSFLC